MPALLRLLPACCLIAGTLLLGSCSEKGPAITLIPDKATDTTYTAPAETPEPRRLLIEESTGVRCTNCPSGDQTIESIKARYPDRVVSVGIHAGAQTDPLSFSRYDFRFPEAEQLMNAYFAEAPGKPAAAFNRVRIGRDRFQINYQGWPGLADTRMVDSQLVNLKVESDYQAAGNQAVFRVHAAFTAPVAGKLSLSLYLVESGIIDPQEVFGAPTPYDTNYVHNHVLRAMLTPVDGYPMLDSIGTKEPGRVYEYRLPYKLKSVWLPQNCHIVAFVHRNSPGDKEVLQVAEVPVH